MIQVSKTILPGVLLIAPEVYADDRGHFKETYRSNAYGDKGVTAEFVQENFSRSSKGVLRGLHFQASRPQGKLVSCLRGHVYDVVVDINPSSRTFRKWVGVNLTDENHLQIYIPPGYAHGFSVLSESADFFYKCTDYYVPNDECGILWSDPDLSIDWLVSNPIVSEKDQKLPRLTEVIG